MGSETGVKGIRLELVHLIYLSHYIKFAHAGKPAQTGDTVKK